MGFGQYSAGSCRRTKSEMVTHFGAQFDIATAKRAGHNRLDFTTADGRRMFALHETVVAELSADRSRLTLADGGWPTPTTKSAWGDACNAFNVSHPSWALMPNKSERSVTLLLELEPTVYGPHDRWHSCFATRELKAVARATDVPRDLPMIRASVEDGNFAVRYDGEAREIRSDAGAKVRATPFKVLVTLYRIDALAKATSRYHAFRGDALYQFNFEAFGFTVNPGQSSRVIMIGCHTFQTREIRAQMARIAADHPEAAKAAKRFVRRNPLDYGIAAYEAAMRARYGRAA